MSNPQVAIMNDIPDRWEFDYTKDVWNISQIFTGRPGSGKFCPKVNDLVYDLPTGWYVVTTIDITTGLSTLVPWSVAPETHTNVVEDQFLGTGPGYTSETWRVNLDTRTAPFILEIDGRLHMYRSNAMHIKIFLGTDVSELTGVVISQYYNASGVYQGENIPLEQVGNDNINNRAIWAPKTGYTTRYLNDGEMVTVVCYSATGHQLSKAKMLIENTSLTRRSEAGRKHVVSIGLKSQYISESNPQLIKIPLNSDMRTIVFTGIVTYNTGEVSEMPVALDGGSRMSINGLRWYSPTVEGYPMPASLSYLLAEDEYSIINGVTENDRITRPIWVEAEGDESVFSLKLYTFPTWNQPANKWDLDYWLYSLDRDLFHKVERQHVELVENTPPFDGTDYVSRQRLSLAIDVSKVNPTFTPHRHRQNVEVILRQPGTLPGTKWEVKTDPAQADWFGANAVGLFTYINVNQSTLDLRNGAVDRNDWLERLFYKVHPTYNNRVETRAPEPTHFILVFRSREYEFSLSQWNQIFTLQNDLLLGEALFIRWTRVVHGAVMELGVTGVAVEQTN